MPTEARASNGACYKARGSFENRDDRPVRPSWGQGYGGPMKVNDSDEPVVADVMNSPVLTVDPETLLGEVARVLAENKVSGLPVVDAMGHVLGGDH